MVKITYKVGDKVFAKVKGYPPWPAQVVGESGKKYNVLFYGTKETGAIKPEDLSYYLKYKSSYVHKYLKRVGYVDAVTQIEEAIKKEGGDGNLASDADEPVHELDVSDASSVSSVQDKKVTKKRTSTISSEGSPAIKSVGKGRKKSASVSSSREPSVEPVAKKARRESSTSNVSRDENDSSKLLNESSSMRAESVTEVKDELNDNKKARENGQDMKENTTVTSDTATSLEESVTETVEKEATKEPELIEIVENHQESPKKPRIEITPKVVVTEQLLKNHILYAEYVKKHAELFKGRPAEKRLNQDEVLPVKLPSGKIGAIKIHQVDQCPLTHSDEFERALYDEKMANAALETLNALTTGAKDVGDVPHEVILDTGKTMDDFREMAFSKDIESKRKRLNRLKKETEMVTWDTQIKNSLGLDKAMPDEALKTLKDFSKFERHLDLLMFMKHPHVMDTIRRLRKYVGNVSEWVMSEEDSEVFAKKTEKIRIEAERIYNKVKNLFDVDSNSTFWDTFMNLLADFRSKCQGMAENDVLLLCAEPDSRQAFLDRIDEVVESETAPVATSN